MRIHIASPAGPYSADVDTSAMDVVIFNAYVGPTFINDSEEKVTICNRDEGFEAVYTTPEGVIFDVKFSEGKVTVFRRK